LSDEPERSTFYYSVKITSVLGFVNCKCKENIKYSVRIDGHTNCLIIEEYGLDSDSSTKPLYLIYPPYIVEYGVQVE